MADTDLPEELLQPNQPQKRHVFRYWVFEILTLLFSTCLFIAIAFLLIKYDGSFLTSWPLPINLNTLVALLSTAFRASVVIVLAEVLSQTKWTWFRNRPRPLSDLQTYDEASRGLLGSLKLLGVLKGGLNGNILALGAAAVTIISLSIGPFTQQAIKTVDCYRTTADSASVEARVLVSNWLPRMEPSMRGELTFGHPEPERGLKAAMISALVNDEVADNSSLFSCPNQDCRFWERRPISYSTVGVCSEYIDPTKLVRHGISEPSGATTVVLADMSVPINGDRGPHLNVSTSPVDDLESIMSQELRDRVKHAWSTANFVRTPLSNVECDAACRLGVSEDSPDYPKIRDFVAATCFLYPCIKDIASIVKGGRLEEEILSTEVIPGEMVGSYSNDFHAVVPSQCFAGPKTYQGDDPSFYQEVVKNITSLEEMDLSNVTALEPSTCFFGFAEFHARRLSDYIQNTFFNDYCGLWGPGVYAISACSTAWWLDSMFLMTKPHGDRSDFESIQRKHHNIAVAMTNYFRKTGEVGDAGNPRHIKGEVHEETLCMQLESPWLMLPAALYLISVALLTGVIISNKRDHRQAVWKASLFPLLFLGLEPRETTNVGSLSEDHKIYEATAKRMLIQLRTGIAGKKSGFVRASSDELVDKRASHEATDSRRSDPERSSVEFDELESMVSRRVTSREPEEERNAVDIELLNRNNNIE